ncbi:MAG: porin, partial [Comamonas sp.]
MRHKIHQHIALGALLACCTAAFAQSGVTLYGRADAGVYHQSRSNPGANQWSLSSDTSYFGLRGNEDLGGGLSATFKLESQVDLSSGASSSAFFNREAYVGLSDRRLGTLQLGSMWGPSVWISG